MLLVGCWIVLPLFLGMLVGRLFHAFAGWLDRRHPDDLPLAAGAWLREQIQKHQLPVRACPARKLEDSANHYLPSSKMIVLEQMVFYKPDPGAWATAAHELGHALFYVGNPRLSALFIAVRRLPRLFATYAVVLVGGNLLYGSREVDTVAFALLVAAALLSLVAITEEALASRRAIQILDDDGRIDSGGRRAVRLELAAALATYVSDLIWQLIALGLFTHVRAVVEARHFVAGAALADWKAAILAGATAALGTRLGRTSLKQPAQSVVWDLPVIAFVAVVWNQPGMMIPTLLAAISAVRLVSLILLPFVVAAGILATLATPRARREISPVLVENLRLGEPEIAAAAGEIEAAYAVRPLLSRLPALAFNLLFLPLVLLYWIHRLFT
jgi:Zn-dependent membrane protease YugP